MCVCGREGGGKGRGEGWMEVLGWDGRGEAMGEGESKHNKPKGHPPPLLPLPPAPLSSSFSPNNEGRCLDRVSKVSAVTSGP